jgi:zinc/manganese transport system substrate-binding protein
MRLHLVRFTRSRGRGGRGAPAGAVVAGAAAVCLAVLVVAAASGCGHGDDAVGQGGRLQVVATTSVLADLAGNVAGGRADVRSLIPLGTDPHAFEPTPGDLRRMAQADVVIVNGLRLEGSLAKYLQDLDTDQVVVATRGLTPRRPRAGEPAYEATGAVEPDPHLWLDPQLAQHYVDTIAAALSKKDARHARDFERNAAAYEQKLDRLDAWIAAQVATLPPARRKLVMNHASHGYWADRYGFRIVGAVIPSVSTGAAPTAAELAALEKTIAREDVPAIFVEVSENPGLAGQIAADTGITVVDDLLDHSLTGPDGVAPSYIAMMKHDTRRIVDALKQ